MIKFKYKFISLREPKDIDQIIAKILTYKNKKFSIFIIITPQNNNVRIYANTHTVSYYASMFNCYLLYELLSETKQSRGTATLILYKIPFMMKHWNIVKMILLLMIFFLTTIMLKEFKIILSNM